MRNANVTRSVLQLGPQKENSVKTKNKIKKYKMVKK